MRLLLADDHAMFRHCLRDLLEREHLEIVGEAGDGRSAVRLAREHLPDIAVLDLGMPLLNGIEAIREIARLVPGTQCVLLTMFDDDKYVIDALRAGARGYVLKWQAATDLLSALAEVARGGVYLSPGIAGTVVDACLSPEPATTDPLTDRERQVLQLIAEGHSTRELADLLSVSVKTAESHRTRMMGKLNLRNTAGLVRYAIRNGVIQV
jgi:two-component system, NarL family, response regulator NreC